MKIGGEKTARILLKAKLHAMIKTEMNVDLKVEAQRFRDQERKTEKDPRIEKQNLYSGWHLKTVRVLYTEYPL